MKFTDEETERKQDMVAPLVGAWIEISKRMEKTGDGRVAPLVGAWIEIVFAKILFFRFPVSLPSWERGLKFWCG